MSIVIVVVATVYHEAAMKITNVSSIRVFVRFVFFGLREEPSLG
jgi:hypothetical protein